MQFFLRPRAFRDPEFVVAIRKVNHAYTCTNVPRVYHACVALVLARVSTNLGGVFFVARALLWVESLRWGFHAAEFMPLVVPVFCGLVGLRGCVHMYACCTMRVFIVLIL